MIPGKIVGDVWYGRKKVGLVSLLIAVARPRIASVWRVRLSGSFSSVPSQLFRRSLRIFTFRRFRKSPLTSLPMTLLCS